MNATGLVRVTVAAPGRRIDLALPGDSSLAEILPDLLGEAGDRLAERGLISAGWTLRRADGSVLEPGSTLAAYRVADGEVLSLMPTRIDWPAHEDDDVSDPGASTQRCGTDDQSDFADVMEIGAVEPRSWWAARHTRWAGLVAGGVAMLLCLVMVVHSGPPWRGPAWWAFGLAALALALAVVLARGLPDAGAGSVYASVGLVCAFVGGVMLVADGHALGARQLLAAGAALLVAAVIGLFGAAGRVAPLAAGATVGLLTVLGAWLTIRESLTGAEEAAVLAGAGLVITPWFEHWSAWLARLPLPVAPLDEPRPARIAACAPVVRADGWLTGMIAGVAVVAVPCQLVLVRSSGTAALILVATLAAGLVLRARRQQTVVRRVALLVAGGSGAAFLAADPLWTDRSGVLSVAGPVLVGVVALVMLVGMQCELRGRRLVAGGRDLFELVPLLAVVPAVCAVLGFYGG